MFTVGETAKEVMAFLGWPSHGALNQRDLISVISRKVREISVDLLNSDRNYYAELLPFNPASRDEAQPFPGVIVRLESRERGSSDEDSWTEWERSDYGDWNAILSRTGYHFATYGTPPRVALSSDPSTLEFRALVETGGITLAELADEVAMGDVVRPLLFNRVATEAGVMVMDVTPEWERLWERKERHLVRERPALERAYTKYISDRREQGTRYREPFNSRRESADYLAYEDANGWLRSG